MLTAEPTAEVARGDRDGFRTTHRSPVLTAGRVGASHFIVALQRLCQTSWHPLYVYVGMCGFQSYDAEDLTQGFLDLIPAGNHIAKASPAKGGFCLGLTLWIND